MDLQVKKKPDQDGLDGVRLIIVVGAGMHQDGTLYEGSKINVEKGVEIFKRNREQVTIFTGKWNYFIKVEPPWTEARAMKEYALSLGIPDDKTIEEGSSYDTVGNAYYTDKIVRKINNVGLITIVAASWHMPKARFVFEKMFGGTRFRISFEEGKQEMSGDMAKRAAENEAKKLDKLKRLYGMIRDGDNEGFAKEIEKVHPFYAVDKSIISEEEWKEIGKTVPTLDYIK